MNFIIDISHRYLTLYYRGRRPSRTVFWRPLRNMCAEKKIFFYEVINPRSELPSPLLDLVAEPLSCRLTNSYHIPPLMTSTPPDGLLSGPLSQLNLEMQDSIHRTYCRAMEVRSHNTSKSYSANNKNSVHVVPRKGYLNRQNSL